MEEEAEKLREKIDDHSAKLKSLEAIESESDITTLITVVEQICTGKYCGSFISNVRVSTTNERCLHIKFGAVWLQANYYITLKL